MYTGEAERGVPVNTMLARGHESTFPCCLTGPSPSVTLILTFLLALPPTQYEGTRLNEEVSEGEEGTLLSTLCVFSSPFVGLQRRSWALDDGPRPSVNTAPHALPESAFSLLGLVFCVDPSPTYCTCAMFGLCVLENPVGEMCPVCCSPVFNVPTFDAFTVATVQLAGTELTLVFKMHHVDLEKEAQHFRLIKPQQI